MAENKGLSQEELQELAELEELEQLEALEAQGKLEEQGSSVPSALLKGAQKGATFGFADEIAGVAGALGGLVGGDKRPLKEIYSEAKSEAQSDEQKAHEESPAAFNVAQIGSGFLLPGFGAAKGGISALAKAGAAQGALMGAGEGEGLTDSIKQSATQGLLGALMGGGLGAAGKAGNALVKGADKASKSLTRTATGASGEAARKLFKEGTEEFLLNKGIVGVGDTVENIAQKAAAQQGQSSKVMGDLIAKAEQTGAASKVADLLSKVDDQIAALKPDASTAPVRSQLEAIKQHILASADGNPNSMVPPSLLEKTKSGFQGNSNYTIPGLDDAQKIAANIYKNEGEQLIGKAIPDDLAAFQQAKNEFGLLSPVIESAEKKASQLNQAQNLGLLDITSAGAGAAAFGPLGAITAPIVQRQIRARGTATGAALLAKIPRTVEGIKSAIPKLAETNPQLAGILQRVVSLPGNKAEKIIAPLISQMGDEFEDAEYPSLFEGKLHDPQDIAQYSEKLKNELSPIERAKAQSALNKDGSVNLPPPEPKPMPAQETPIRKPITLEDMSANVKQRQY